MPQSMGCTLFFFSPHNLLPLSLADCLAFARLPYGIGLQVYEWNGYEVVWTFEEVSVVDGVPTIQNDIQRHTDVRRYNVLQSHTMLVRISRKTARGRDDIP